MTLKVRQAMQMRDAQVKVAVTNALRGYLSSMPEHEVKKIITSIEQVIDQAGKEWESRTLTSVFGVNKARKMIAQMNRLVLG